MQKPTAPLNRVIKYSLFTCYSSCIHCSSTMTWKWFNKKVCDNDECVIQNGYQQKNYINNNLPRFENPPPPPVKKQIPIIKYPAINFKK